MESDSSLPCSQKPTTGFCELYESRSHTHSPFLGHILILSSHVCLSLPNCLFPSVFWINSVHIYMSHTCYMLCLPHPPWFAHPKNISWRVQLNSFLHCLQTSSIYMYVYWLHVILVHLTRTPTTYNLYYVNYLASVFSEYNICKLQTFQSRHLTLPLSHIWYSDIKGSNDIVNQTTENFKL